MKNVLIIKDHFTCYTQVYVTKNHTWHALQFFSVFRFPYWLMSNKVREFMDQVISELCDLLSVMKIWTLPYDPQTNGSVEQVHQMLRRMIAKIDPDKRAKWLSHLGPILIAYNATRSLINGYSPYFLIFWVPTEITSEPVIPNC